MQRGMAMRSVKWAVAAGLLATTAIGLAIAQTGGNANVGVPAPLIDGLRQGAFVEQYVAQTVSRLRSADPDGDGLDRGDIDYARTKNAAHQRASTIQQVLGLDFDGDFKVTRAEIEYDRRGDRELRAERVNSTLERYDLNRDGVITLQEAAMSGPKHRSDDRLDPLLALDPNGDGRLTATELTALAQRSFESVDRDGDGQISKEEYARVAEGLRELQFVRDAAVCKLPPVADGARLIAYGGYEGDAISSAAVGGPDKETGLIDVAIEPGSEPLYLFLSSFESTVWRFSGATGRVANVVVSSPSGSATGVSAAGVVGIPAGKVAVADAGCLGYFYQVDGGEVKRTMASLRASLKRSPDAVFGAYSAQRVSLPSGQITRAERGKAPLPKGFDAGTWPDAARFWPGGLVQIDPNTVVAKAGVERYKVLPSQMGISQLVGSGAIVRDGQGRFRLVRPIAHMPPSMGGAHSVTLIIAKGVPVPPGSPGHSCIISEASGEKMGPLCQRH